MTSGCKDTWIRKIEFVENELCYSRNKNQATKLFLRLNFGNDLIFVLKSNNSQFSMF